MPDTIGRYAFSEMARLVRDRLLAVRKTVDPITGEETGSTITNQLISNTDILAKFNSVLTGIYTDAITRKPDLFESDRSVEMEAGLVDYQFPLGMLQFSQMLWLKPGAPDPPQPWDFVPMVCVDDAHDFDIQVGQFSVPTWRRIGNNFQLNRLPTSSEEDATVVVRGVFLPLPLLDDLASPKPPPARSVLQGPFPTLVQELMMLEAAKKLASEKMQQWPASLDEELMMWRQRVDIAINNAQQPRSVQITSGYLVQSTYSGRRRGRGWR